ncbi:Basic-leucine zipper domain [Sesbania bispinosa]|nr:Basic-leucine zipper domain [Sesbania bispinosa]
MSPFSIGTCIEDDLGTTGCHSLYDDTIGNDLLSTFFNMDKLNPSSGALASTTDNFAVASGTTNINERLDVGSQHSQFMNGSTSIINPNILVSASEIDSTMNSRKTIPPISIGTCIEDDLGTTGGHSLYDDTTGNELLCIFFNKDKLNPSSGAPASIADNFVVASGTTNINERLDVGSQHSQIMSGSTSIVNPDILVSASEIGSTMNSRKAMSPFSIGTCIEDILGTTDGHSLYDDTTGNDLLSTFFNMDKLNPSSGAPASTTDNFAVSSGTTNINERLDVGSQHSQFMNGSTSIINPDILLSASEIGSTMNSRKAMSAFSIGTCINDDLGTMDSHPLSSGTIDENLLSANLNMDKINPSSGVVTSAADNFSIAISTTNINETLDVGSRDSQFMNGSTSIIKPDMLVSAFENGSTINSKQTIKLAIASGTTNINERLDVGSQHSQFMNGSTSIIKPDMLVSASENGSTINSRKAKSATELAEIALVDPKRAKRILANRQSAIKSKEKKAHYISELEKKVQTLETEKTSLSTQRENQRKDDENNELRLGLQTLIQQLHLDDGEFMLL